MIRLDLDVWCIPATVLGVSIAIAAIGANRRELNAEKIGVIEPIRTDARTLAEHARHIERFAERDTIVLMRDDITMIRRILEGNHSSPNDCAASTWRAVHAAACGTVAVSDGEAGHRGR